MADAKAQNTSQLLGDLVDMEVELKSIDALAQKVGSTLVSGFRAAVTGSKSLRAVLADIGRSLADIALKAAFKPLENLAGQLVGQVLGAGLGGQANVRPFAKGGVLAAPTYFPHGQGLGLAGEAGPEAIMPLTRGSDGRLGVKSDARAPTSITFNVKAADARSFVAAEAEVSAMLLRAVRRGARAS